MPLMSACNSYWDYHRNCFPDASYFYNVIIMCEILKCYFVSSVSLPSFRFFRFASSVSLFLLIFFSGILLTVRRCVTASQCHLRSFLDQMIFDVWSYLILAIWRHNGAKQNNKRNVSFWSFIVSIPRNDVPVLSMYVGLNVTAEFIISQHV